ncbi:MAG: metallophosphatase domain-containing protein [Desulfobacterales bacterium]|nr:metallophosphatase domain-containing protein [Desulfobacterales bacterium]
MTLKIIAVSDTHNHYENLVIPNGDIFIHAGDITISSQMDKIAKFNDFLGNLPHKYKIVVAGNHDRLFEKLSKNKVQSLLTNAIYLEDQAAKIEGINFYGSPWLPWFLALDMAFAINFGTDLRNKWNQIPVDTDILITHCPPYGHLDIVDGINIGCADLLNVVEKINPKYHIFGHLHENYGISSNGKTKFINASICEGIDNPIRFPVEIIF